MTEEWHRVELVIRRPDRPGETLMQVQIPTATTAPVTVARVRVTAVPARWEVFLTGLMAGSFVANSFRSDGWWLVMSVVTAVLWVALLVHAVRERGRR